MVFAANVRLRIPPHLRASVLSAVGRLELKFDPRIGVKRVKRYQFDFYKETVPYGCLVLVSLASSWLVVGRGRHMQEILGGPGARRCLGLELQNGAPGAAAVQTLAIEGEAG